MDLASFRPFVCASALALFAASAQSAVIIHFTGMNLSYDGAAIYDGASAAGGVGDPATADALTTADFYVDGTLVGSLNSNIWLDVFIPNVTGLAAGANSSTTITTPGNAGFFDLLIGTSPLASEFLITDIGSVSITYSNIAGFAHFLFGATFSDTYAQNLPFGLAMAGPVMISFSAQLQDVTTAGGFVTGFNAFGTGEFNEVPAPASALLIAGLAAPALRRRRAA